jgi:hypothetical protein
MFVQERRVGFVGFGHDEVAGAELGVGAGAVQSTTDHEGRIETALRQHARHQACGRGLAVGARNRNALLQPHEFGQHHRARHDRNALGARGHHLRIVRLDRGRRHDRIRALDILSRMTLRDLCTQFRQAQRCRIAAEVRSGYGVAEVEQHLCDAAHAGTADANEVNIFDFMFHACLANSSSTFAICSLASRRPIA